MGLVFSFPSSPNPERVRRPKLATGGRGTFCGKRHKIQSERNILLSRQSGPRQFISLLFRSEVISPISTPRDGDPRQAAARVVAVVHLPSVVIRLVTGSRFFVLVCGFHSVRLERTEGAKR
jgi:hypothetical protein